MCNATIPWHHKSYGIRRIYRALIEHDLPILAGEKPPTDMKELLAPEFAAIAGLVSRRARGEKIMVAALMQDHPGYDGAAFAAQYRAQRLPKYMESKKRPPLRRRARLQPRPK